MKSLPNLATTFLAIGVLLCGAVTSASAATQYTYDDLNRLTKVQYDDGRSITYTYDPAGNLLGISKAGRVIPGLVGHWTFDGCDARDSSGNANHGSFMGAPACATGKFGKALRFNGVSDAIQVPTSASFPQNGVTLSYWVNREGLASGGVLQNYLSKELAFQSYLMTDNSFVGGLWLGTSGSWSEYGRGLALIPTLTDWVHFAFSFDNQTRVARTYINGVLASQKTETNANSIVRTSGFPLYIGRNGSAAVYWIKGLMDEVRIYNRALNTQEVESLAGKPVGNAVTLPVADFVNGLNVAINAEPGNVCRNGLLYNAPPYTERPNAASWNVNLATTGRYLIEVEYAAQDSRPVDLLIDGAAAASQVLAGTTGGWCVNNLQRVGVGSFDLSAGTHTITFNRPSVFPHFSRIFLTRQ